MSSTIRLKLSDRARSFIFRKKAVRAATLKKWPGNEILTFRNNKESLKQLNELVEETLEECAFPQVAFDGQAIGQHILDILNERRRSVRKGHDYTKVPLFFSLRLVLTCFGSTHSASHFHIKLTAMLRHQLLQVSQPSTSKVSSQAGRERNS